MRRRVKQSKQFHLIRGKGDKTYDAVTETENDTVCPYMSYGDIQQAQEYKKFRPERVNQFLMTLFVWTECLCIWTIHYCKIVHSVKGRKDSSLLEWEISAAHTVSCQCSWGD